VSLGVAFCNNYSSISNVLNLAAVDLELDYAQVFAAIPSTAFCAWYFFEKHWLANNMLGLAFSIQVRWFTLWLVAAPPSCQDHACNIDHSLFFLTP
jgi:hypothetical protein